MYLEPKGTINNVHVSTVYSGQPFAIAQFTNYHSSTNLPFHGRYAVQSISTSAFRGSVFTANVARAGGFSGNRVP